jgi:hypothetical protein
MGLAVLEDPSVKHGPIEVLVTYDEETGMTGANSLKPGVLKGDILINLDSEEEGELCVGCAGGLDVTGDFKYRTYKTTCIQLNNGRLVWSANAVAETCDNGCNNNMTECYVDKAQQAWDNEIKSGVCGEQHLKKCAENLEKRANAMKEASKKVKLQIAEEEHAEVMRRFKGKVIVYGGYIFTLSGKFEYGTSVVNECIKHGEVLDYVHDGKMVGKENNNKYVGYGKHFSLMFMTPHDILKGGKIGDF